MILLALSGGCCDDATRKGPRVPEHCRHTQEGTNRAELLPWQVLIGDAAHACYNYAGQGTNLALEDGLILENILVQELDVSG
jgi:2-polyprenyl-6-methoxyphenol hydroxylase-like FAD-dependent oxidoreductase